MASVARPFSRLSLLPIFAAAALVVSAVGGTLVVASSASERSALITLIGLILISGLFVWSKLSVCDPFDPFIVFFAAWLVMFVVRSVVMMDRNEFMLRNTYNIQAGFDRSLFLAALGGFGFMVGNLAPLLKERSSSGYLRISQAPVGPSDAAAWSALGAGAIGTVTALDSFGRGLGGSTAYLYFLPLMIIPAVLLLLAYRFTSFPLPKLLWIAILCLFLITFVTIGQRGFVLLAVIPIVVCRFALRQARPRWSRIIGASMVGWLVIVAFLGNFRTTDSSLPLASRAQSSIAHTFSSSALEDVFLGPSTEMLPALSLEIQTYSTVWAHEPGYLAKQVLSQWIPRAIYPAKLKSVPEYLYSQYFPGHYLESRANTQFSVIGELYFDSGVVGVIIGLLLLGFFARKIHQSFIAATTPLGQIFFCPVIPLFIILLRGDISLTLSIAFYIYAPLVFVLFAERLRR